MTRGSKMSDSYKLNANLAKGLFDNLQIKHGIVDCTNCKYSLPGCLSHFAAETLERVFVGCSLARGVASPNARNRHATQVKADVSRIAAGFCQLCFPHHLLWEQLPFQISLRPRREKEQGGSGSAKSRVICQVSRQITVITNY